ncbi:MAG TPA: adenylate/guanylate cyclase domain-containing protein [Gemmatimonadota bacterium]|nr:adenylate/guanylate cyclase domain-containing protein [Gemmatimonadota bacterium]
MIGRQLNSRRSLQTVLFTDIVGSTERATELGDQGWSEILEEHHGRVRREIHRFGGREIKALGDGFLATFAQPAQAIRCAWSVRETVRELGLSIRGGIHTGQVDHRGRDVGGIAIHICARIAAEAEPGEILVSNAVREMETGTGFRFEDRGKHALKGVPGEWRLFGLRSLPAGPAGPASRTLRRLSGFTAGQMRAAGGVVIALLILVSTVYLVNRSSRGIQTSEGALTTAGPGIAVLPFHVIGEGLEGWDESMVDLLSTNLDGVAGLRSIDSRTVISRWEDAIGDDGAEVGQALAVARGTGARFAVLGRAVTIGSGVRLTTEVYDLGDDGGSRLGQAIVEGVPDSIFQLVDRLSIEMVGLIPTPESRESPAIGLAAVTTDSLRALKAYLEGHALFRGSDFLGAFQRYERATDIDSTFALAHYMQGLATGWGGFEEAIPFLEKAARHSERLPRRKQLIVHGYLALHSGSLQSRDSLALATRLYPEDLDAWAALGEALFHIGAQLMVHPTASDSAFERALAINSTLAPNYIHLIDNAFGHHADGERARRLVAAYGRLTPGSREAPLYRTGLRLTFGGADDRHAAWQVVDTLAAPSVRFIERNLLWHPSQLALREAVVTASPPEPRKATELAIARLARGRVAGALAALAEPGVSDEAALGLLYLARSWGASVPEPEVARVLGALDLSQASPSVAFFAGAFAVDRGRRQEVEAARGRLARVADSLRSAGDPHGARFAAGVGKALAGYARWRQGGSPREAFATVAEAQREATAFLWPQDQPNAAIRLWLARLALELGDDDQAERYLSTFWGYREPFGAYADLELARLLDRRDREDEAEERYARVVAAWNAADPALRDRVQFARDRLDEIHVGKR